jgi:cytochrome c oxidase assembly protein Cox11
MFINLLSFLKKNILFFIVLGCLSVFFWLLFFTYFAVPFFKLLCQDTGPNGLYGLLIDLKKRSLIFEFIFEYFVFFKNTIFWFVYSNTDLNSITSGNFDQKKLRFVDVSVVFKVNDLLPLKFNSNGLKHHISVDIPQLLFCVVENYSTVDLIFTSIYNVYPAEALPHIEKIQCFCYDDQLVEAKSNLYLPIYYRLASSFSADPLMANVSEVTLSYSIFKS